MSTITESRATESRVTESADAPQLEHPPVENPQFRNPNAGPVGTELIGRYPDYASAQAVVDRLSDAGFPVRHVTIVGEDLQVVEAVTGRLTTARAAAAGAARGLWIGLALTLLLQIIGPLSVAGFLVAFLVPALVSAVFAGVAHALLRGRRDFTSLQTITASRYAVLVAVPHAGDARGALLGRWPAAP